MLLLSDDRSILFLRFINLYTFDYLITYLMCVQLFPLQTVCFHFLFTMRFSRPNIDAQHIYWQSKHEKKIEKEETIFIDNNLKLS